MIELLNFSSLTDFRANNTSLQMIIVKGEYPNLTNFDLSKNPLE
jgi:hypothetical protein